MSQRYGAANERIAGFDGLRAFAVLLVFVSHIWLGVPELIRYGWYKVFTRGGFLGVNVFFVLSGFLIAFRLSLIDTGRLRAGLRGYYASRVMRIMPLALLFLGLHLFYVATWGFPAEFGRSEEITGILSTILQYSNFAVLQNPSVLIDNVAIWSLSIEGQFYACAPLLVIPLAVVTRSRRWLTGLLIPLFVFLVLRAARVYESKGWFEVYLRTDTRIISLLFGVAGAFVWLGCSNRFPRLLATASVAAVMVQSVIVARAGADGLFMWKGGMALFDLASLVLVLALAYASCPLVRLLETGPVRWLGKISYGLYLWQLPVIWMFKRHGLSLDWRLRLLLVPTVVIGLSALTWRYFEEPLLRSAFTRRLRGASRGTAPQHSRVGVATSGTVSGSTGSGTDLGARGS